LENSSTEYYYIKGKFEPGNHFIYPDSFMNNNNNKLPDRGILFKTDAFSIVAITEEKQRIGYVTSVTTEKNEIIKTQFNEDGRKEYIVVTLIPCEDNDCRNDDGTGKIYVDEENKFICIDSTRV